jgi:hypothetical protein
MNLIKFNKNLTAILFIAIIASLPILFTSCEKDTIAPSEHFEPQGLQIKDATKKVIIKIMNGEFNAQYSDEFEVPLNSMTEELEVEFLDANGSVIEPPTSSEYSLKLTFGDNTIAQIYQHDGERWAFHIKGLKAGVTDVELSFNHNDHADFKTPKIKVHVEDSDEVDIHEVKLINNDNGITLVEIDDENKVVGNIIVQVSKSLEIKFNVLNHDNEVVNPDDYELQFDFANAENICNFDVTNFTNSILKLNGKSKGKEKVIVKIITKKDNESETKIQAEVELIVE